MAEIRAPFIQAGIYSTLGAVLMIFFGSALFLRITQPMIQKIKDSELEFRHLFDSSERKYQTLFHASNDAMMIFANNEVMDCNDATLKMFACKNRDDILGKHLSALSPPKQPNGITSNSLANEHFSSAFQTGSNIFEWQHRRTNGEEFAAEMLLAAIDLGERPVIQATVRDITLRKQAEEKLEHQKTELEASNKELESYSYSIAHDLRSPLRAITGFSQILMEDAKDQLDADQLGYLGRIVAAGKNMAHLIDDILELSRITRRELHHGKVNLSAIARDIMKRMIQEHPDKNVQWRMQDDMFAKGDSTLLTVTLQNLLENAWKFTRDKTPAIIEMSKKQVDDEIAFYVKDNGVGFDMKHKGNLFKPFNRLHPRDYEGTGIGLATVHRIIQRHGGRVWAEAEEEKGATFYFTLGT